MSEGTKEYDPRVEATLLRDRVQELELLVLKQGKQLVTAGQNFIEVTRVLKALITQGNANAKALLTQVDTVRQQQVQIEGLALIQRLSKRPALPEIGHTPAEVSPFTLDGKAK